MKYVQLAYQIVEEIVDRIIVNEKTKIISLQPNTLKEGDLMNIYRSLQGGLNLDKK